MQRARIFSERDILKLANTPFIVNLHFWFQDDDYLYFVLDYAECGDLFNLINTFKETEELSIEIGRFITAEILVALEFLHENNIIYRDIKPQNVLVDKEGHVKLCDFGLAKARFDSSQENTLWGTVKYMAPEILMYQKYGFTADFWSLGILLYRVSTGELPYNDSDVSKIKNKIKFEDFKLDHESFDDDTIDILRKLLTKDPKKRLGAKGIDQIKKHPFYKNINWDKLKKKQITVPFDPELLITQNIDVEGQDNKEEIKLKFSTGKGLSRSKKKTEKMFKQFTYINENIDMKKIEQEEKNRVTSGEETSRKNE